MRENRLRLMVMNHNSFSSTISQRSTAAAAATLARRSSSLGRTKLGYIVVVSVATSVIDVDSERGESPCTGFLRLLVRNAPPKCRFVGHGAQSMPAGFTILSEDTVREMKRCARTLRCGPRGLKRRPVMIIHRGVNHVKQASVLDHLALLMGKEKKR